MNVTGRERKVKGERYRLISKSKLPYVIALPSVETVDSVNSVKD